LSNAKEKYFNLKEELKNEIREYHNKVHEVGPLKKE
jgi:hypothetical protein